MTQLNLTVFARLLPRFQMNNVAILFVFRTARGEVLVARTLDLQPVSVGQEVAVGIDYAVQCVDTVVHETIRFPVTMRYASRLNC